MRNARWWAAILATAAYGQLPTPTPPQQPLAALGLIEAIKSTLAHHPLLFVQEQQVAFDRGVAQQQAGLFDPVFADSASYVRSNQPLTKYQQSQAQAVGITINDVPANLADLTSSYQRLFRNGISISPQLTINHTGDPLQNLTGTNITSAEFTLTIPFLRGRGRDVVAAQETAANVEVAASGLDLSQEAANLMEQCTEAYWDLRAAQLAYQVALESEQRGQVFLDAARTLVDADKVARNELNQVVANLAERASTRLAALQNVVAARQQLALAMGIGYDQLAAMDATLSDDLPNGENVSMPSDDPADIQYYLSQTMLNRADVLAAAKREDEARGLVVAAKNLVEPTLNLSLSGGYTGLREGHRPDQYLLSLYGLHGPDASAALTYSFPQGRDTAYGQLAQSVASVRQAELKKFETQRQVSSGVIVALGAIRNSISRLTKARESVEAYERALQGERDKWRLGIGSLIDILTMEDRLTAAQNDQVSAKLAYAVAVAQFRLATGTLMAPDKPVQNIERVTFETLPFTGRPRSNP
jgi:outer membrane protein TolC